MMTPHSSQFLLSPESWLGRWLDSEGQSLVVLPKVALSYECQAQKGETIPEELRTSLEREMSEIDAIPDTGVALRSDRVEAFRARESGESQNPSVDACIRARTALMLVECKYRAMPETSIVKSVKTFHETVCRKFDASQSFYAHEGARSFCDERVVLFNCDSKDKVLSMFRRLCLEDADSSLRRYVILDTHDFWARYHDMIGSECA